ncbi:MAG: hypothetical protein II766_04035 [Paludibacteraceae bacterium]|nr:hypothetical protein [Paludibacteraceae bacterium]
MSLWNPVLVMGCGAAAIPFEEQKPSWNTSDSGGWNKGEIFAGTDK